MFKSRDTETQTEKEYTHYHYKGPLSKAIDIARHYGFALIRPIPCDSKIDEHPLYLHDHHKEATLHFYNEHKNDLPHPTLICHTRNPRRKNATITLEVIGSNKSIAEALLIRTAAAILKEHGEKNIHIDINSLGDEEAHERFKKRYVEHYKRHIERVPDAHHSILREDPFNLAFLHEDHDELKEVHDEAPSSVSFLGEPDRRHLKEVLEYIECMGYPYKINKSLIGKHDGNSHVFFHIRKIDKRRASMGAGKILARGERYDRLARKVLKTKHPVHFTAVSIELTGGKHESYRKSGTQKQKPLIYFMHLGPEARQKSLHVLETLRELKFPVKQHVMKESLSEQMAIAEKMQVPYVMIMGLKEAQENSVIFRDMQTRAQNTVDVESLKRYLRKVVK